MVVRLLEYGTGTRTVPVGWGADPIIERPKNWLGMRHKLFRRSNLGNVDGTSTLNSSHASNLEPLFALLLAL